MLSKLFLRNIKKSYKDYSIYFLTLIIGVAIFYVFNSIESQQAMLQLSENQKDIVKLLITLLSGVSVGVSVILGFLVIYANGFLIRKRKKEFGIYMTLGMSKRSISRILLGETLVIGAISLIIGLAVGVFASQLMSILIGKMFEADMESYRFVFSEEATIKTVIYFGIMFLLVILFNVIAIGRFKLVELLNASRKNQIVRIKNPLISVCVFLASAVILGYAYYSVTGGANTLTNQKMLIAIVLGSLGTYLFFWSLSGFFLAVLQKSRNIYYRGLNVFILRQIHNKINTMVFTMTIICLLLFISIGAISSGLSLKETCNEEIKSGAPADFYIGTNIRAKQYVDLESTMKEIGVPFEQFQEYIQIPKYTSKELTMEHLLSEDIVASAKKAYKMILWDAPTEIYSVSDYNKIAKLYGNKTFSLKENEYVALCTFRTFLDWQNESLKDGVTVKLDGKTYQTKYNTCQRGMTSMGSARTEFNTIIVPDSAIRESKNMRKAGTLLVGNYLDGGKEKKEKIEKQVVDILEQHENEKGLKDADCMTRIVLKESSAGVTVIVTFVGLYIGIIFLITSAALLALKELSEAADNRERYALLRKLGTENQMIHKALFWQIAIFFFMPMLLALIHSIFGIRFITSVLIAEIGNSHLKPILTSAAIYGVLYFVYFISTYFGSKRIVEE